MRRAALTLALLALLAPAATARAQDAPEPAVGGGSFNAAPLLDPGVTYRDSLLLGEYLYYALELQAGQRMHVSVRVPDVELETWQSGQDAFSIDLHSPQRERLGTPVAEDVAGNGNTGPPGVTRRNLDEKLRWEYFGPRAEPFLEAAEDLTTYAGPGTWYVSLHSVRANDRTTVAELPIEITLDAEGEPVPEEPDPTPTPEATPTPPPDDDGGAEPADADDGGPSPLTLLGLGALGLAAGLVAGRALGRR